MLARCFFLIILQGLLRLSGGAWNASIVSEAVSWGDQSYSATGLGAYIAQMTVAGGYYAYCFWGVSAMSADGGVCFNKCVWRPLYVMSAKKIAV